MQNIPLWCVFFLLYNTLLQILKDHIKKKKITNFSNYTFGIYQLKSESKITNNFIGKEDISLSYECCTVTALVLVFPFYHNL